MTDEIAKKIIEYLEFVLSPINAKFLSFIEPTVMYSMSREAGDNRSILSSENKITIYTIKFITDFGEVSMSIHSDDLSRDLKSAVCVSFGYSSSLLTVVSKEKIMEINHKLGELLRRKN